jgi:cytochrome c-type biogenesis protein CcmH
MSPVTNLSRVGRRVRQSHGVGPLAWLVAALLFALSLLVSPARAELPRHPSETLVASHIVAPCCWEGTLETHESPLAAQLRAEIRTRLHAGESAELIEGDLIARYGEKARARPNEGALTTIVLVLGAGALLMALVLVAKLRSWAKKPGPGARVASPPGEKSARKASDEAARDEAYDKRLDAELAALDE